FSHTGIMGTYYFSDDMSLSLAVARGWEQSLEDNNEALEGIISWAHTCSEKFEYAINLSFGPQQDDDESHYRTMVDFWCDYAIADQLSLGFNADYRYDSANAADGNASCVWGFAGYGVYTVNDYLKGVARLEYFNDTQRLDGFDAIIYSATLGVTLTPFPNDAVGKYWKLRPEIRYDHASEDIFDGGEKNRQLTLGLETYFTF
ncbi:MAG: porin, partial [Phycisphaerae bacterium]|nr:porin [Phycisphaerae bacterium]